MDGPGTVTGGVKWLLRLEGLALLAAAITGYAHLGGTWGRFALLFLVPDLSMLGYLIGRKIGAVCYNCGHSTIGALGLGGIGFALAAPQIQLIALIWLAHIGFDRAVGYGLKYDRAFGATHLGLVGKEARGGA